MEYKFPSKLQSVFNGLSDEEYQMLNIFDTINEDNFYITIIPYTKKTDPTSFNTNDVDSFKGLFNELYATAKGVSSQGAQSLSKVTNRNGFIENNFKFVEKNGESIKIKLPMKTEMFQFNESHQWNLGNSFFDNRIKKIFELIKSVVDTGKDIKNKGVLEGLKSGGADILKSGEKLLTSWVQSEMNEAMKSIIGQSGGFLYYPQINSFDGTAEIQFSFNWQFIPRNKADAQTLKTIIEIFQILSYSEKSVNSTGKARILKNPPIWKVKFPSSIQINPKTENAYFCVVENVSVGINGEKQSYFRDGFPNTVNLQLQFKEYIPTASRNDVFS